MAQFLTTRGIGHNIENIIKDAQKTLYIVTPYIKLEKNIYSQLQQASRRGVDIVIIYGKTELNTEQYNLLSALNCRIFYRENLHAKCYANDRHALICSMNLHSFSEVNNDEMGVLFDLTNDYDNYNSCLSNVNFILDNSILKSEKKVQIVQSQQAIVVEEYDFSDFLNHWYKRLKKEFPKSDITKVDTSIFSGNDIYKGMTLSTDYGFVTLEFQNKNSKLLREKHLEDIKASLSNYRVYWNSPYNSINIYHKKDINFKNVNDDVEYCYNGLIILLNKLREINL
ncbi:MAG: hypothetical protein J0L80_07510 [Chitinophagales bacterium]|nr:hypothetical protein [Chitinophagales bacterium]